MSVTGAHGFSEASLEGKITTRGTNVPRVSTSHRQRTTVLLTDKKIQLLYYDVSFPKTKNFTIIYIREKGEARCL